MTRLLLVLALLVPAACKDDKKQAPPAETAKPAAAPKTPAADTVEEPPAGADQTLKQAMELICDAPNRAEVPEGATDSARAQAVATWIQSNVSNPEALELMGDLASVMPADRGSMLSDEAKKQGIGNCALAQMR
jgi:predicted lipoprotein